MMWGTRAALALFLIRNKGQILYPAGIAPLSDVFIYIVNSTAPVFCPSEHLNPVIEILYPVQEVFALYSRNTHAEFCKYYRTIPANSLYPSREGEVFGALNVGLYQIDWAMHDIIQTIARNYDAIRVHECFGCAWEKRPVAADCRSEECNPPHVRQGDGVKLDIVEPVHLFAQQKQTAVFSIGFKRNNPAVAADD